MNTIAATCWPHLYGYQAKIRKQDVEKLRLKNELTTKHKLLSEVLMRSLNWHWSLNFFKIAWLSWRQAKLRYYKVKAARSSFHSVLACRVCGLPALSPSIAWARISSELSSWTSVSWIVSAIATRSKSKLPLALNYICLEIVPLHLRSSQFCARVNFGAVSSLPVLVLLGTTIIDRFKKLAPKARGKIVPCHSRPVQVLLSHDAYSEIEKNDENNLHKRNLKQLVMFWCFF